MYIYLASSWRNPLQPDVVAALRSRHFETYDFRHPASGNEGFSWREIDPAGERWTPEQFRKAMQHPVARRGYGLDIDALKRCDVCVMLQPCGRSAALELGYAVGAGKRTAALLSDGSEPELMLKMADRLFVDLEELLVWLQGLREGRRDV